MLTTHATCERYRARLVPFIAGLILMVSCAPYRDIEVTDFTVDNFVPQGAKVVINFSATVNNPNRAFVIHSAGGDLSLGQQPFAVAELMRAIPVPAHTQERCSGQLQLTIKDLMAAFQLGFDAKSWDLDSFLFTGDLLVKSAWVKKKFKYKEIPLNQLVNMLQP